MLGNDEVLGDGRMDAEVDGIALAVADELDGIADADVLGTTEGVNDGWIEGYDEGSERGLKDALGPSEGIEDGYTAK